MSQHYLEWLENYIKETYKTPILENFLGLEAVQINDGKIIYKTKIADEQCNMYGFIHGGTLASLSDIAMGMACITQGKRVVTIDMNISYIKNAPAGSTVTAVGSVISSGRTIMRSSGEIYDENNQLLVKSQASYFVTGEFKETEE